MHIFHSEIPFGNFGLPFKKSRFPEKMCVWDDKIDLPIYTLSEIQVTSIGSTKVITLLFASYKRQSIPLPKTLGLYMSALAHCEPLEQWLSRQSLSSKIAPRCLVARNTGYSCQLIAILMVRSPPECNTVRHCIFAVFNFCESCGVFFTIRKKNVP